MICGRTPTHAATVARLAAEAPGPSGGAWNHRSALARIALRWVISVRVMSRTAWTLGSRDPVRQGNESRRRRRRDSRVAVTPGRIEHNPAVDSGCSASLCAPLRNRFDPNLSKWQPTPMVPNAGSDNRNPGTLRWIASRDPAVVDAHIPRSGDARIRIHDQRFGRTVEKSAVFRQLFAGHDAHRATRTPRASASTRHASPSHG